MQCCKFACSFTGTEDGILKNAQHWPMLVSIGTGDNTSIEEEQHEANSKCF